MKTSTSSLSFPCACGSPSFALISVLALVSLAALTATAFLASARLERTATRPLGEKVRLEMALNIGFNCAKEIINDGMGSSYDNIATYWRGTNATDFTNDVGYLLLGVPRDTNPATPRMYWYAAFSTAQMTELATNSPPSLVMTNRITVTNQSMFSNAISKFMSTNTDWKNGSTNIELIGHTAANARTSPPVGWITIKQPVRTTPGKTNTIPTPVMRIAFFTEDLSGLIDAERMCGAPNRDTGTNPTEISMNNIGPSGITFGTSTNNRATYLSPFLLASNGPIATTNLRYFATGLRSWTNAIQRIPRSIAIGISKNYGGATNGDGAKVVIDNSSTVSKIASALTTNLPDFSTRSGAMNPTAYVSNIAANIVDYIDTDSTPTADNVDNPTYLGIENIPWPNEIFDSIVFKNSITSAPQLRIQLKDMVEVWNMGNKPIPSGTSISISNNYDMMLTFTNTALLAGFRTNLTSMQDLDNGNTTSWRKYRTFTTTNTIPPNGYAMLQSDKSANGTLHFTLGVTLTNAAWYSTAAIRAAWFLYPSSNDATTNMTYKARLGSGSAGQVIQTTLSGRWTRYLATTLKLAVDPTSPSTYIFCNNIGYASQTSLAGVPAHTGGDPRAQLFLSGSLFNQNYTNGYATPGGRNTVRSQVSTYPESEVNPLKLWPDNGHTTNSDLGGDPTKATQSPMTFSTTSATNNWVMRRNDTGLLTNIVELGNIYDPMQWGDQSGSGIANQPGLWTNLTSSATNDSRFGGRNTLRIGRPEHSRFAFTNLGTSSDLPVPNMGQSAAALLDIFCTTNAIDDGGKININTAPGPVLAALAGGITLKADSANTNAVDNTKMVTAFTNGVMKFRQAYPFYSPSQLPFISTNYGNTNWTNSWHTATVFSTNTGCGLNGNELNDEGMEEWFSKIYGLSSVQSRNFRVYVYAQLVNSNNVPYGRIMRKYYHIFAEQTAEATGTIFSGAGFSMVPERESEY